MTQKQTKYFKNEQLTYFEIDAKDQTLGRLATQVSNILSGKGSPQYSPNVSGDYVIIINADKVRVTGKKSEQKTYHRHTGHMGGGRKTAYGDMKPNHIVTLAIKGMLPKTKLGREMQRKLKVYCGAEHPHEAQKPIKLES